MMDFPFFRVSTRSGFGVLVSKSLTLDAIIIQFLSVSSSYPSVRESRETLSFDNDLVFCSKISPLVPT